MLDRKMPSVMDIIQFRNKFGKSSIPVRNQIFSDAIAWLDSDIKPNVGTEDAKAIEEFQQELQKAIQMEVIPSAWYSEISNTYARYPFFYRFMKRVL